MIDSGDGRLGIPVNLATPSKICGSETRALFGVRIKACSSTRHAPGSVSARFLVRDSGWSAVRLWPGGSRRELLASADASRRRPRRGRMGDRAAGCRCCSTTRSRLRSGPTRRARTSPATGSFEAKNTASRGVTSSSGCPAWRASTVGKREALAKQAADRVIVAGDRMECRARRRQKTRFVEDFRRGAGGPMPETAGTSGLGDKRFARGPSDEDGCARRFWAVKSRQSAAGVGE
jgi:hypothetical protein